MDVTAESLRAHLTQQAHKQTDAKLAELMAAADEFEQRLQPWAPVADRLDAATREQLLAMAKHAI